MTGKSSFAKRRFLGGIASCGRDWIEPDSRVENDKGRYVSVVNYTHRYFALGFTTSAKGSVGFIISNNVAKRGNQNGYGFTEFRGFIANLAVGYGKVYLYLFLRGDGLR